MTCRLVMIVPELSTMKPDPLVSRDRESSTLGSRLAEHLLSRPCRLFRRACHAGHMGGLLERFVPADPASLMTLAQSLFDGHPLSQLRAAVRPPSAKKPTNRGLAMTMTAFPSSTRPAAIRFSTSRLVLARFLRSMRDNRPAFCSLMIHEIFALTNSVKYSSHVTVAQVE